MGKASRLKKERRQAPPVGKQAAAIPQRAVLLGTVGFAVAIGIVVAVLLATRSSPKPPPAANPSSGDQNASPALVRAADAVGFSATVEPGAGLLESRPASAARPPSNPGL